MANFAYVENEKIISVHDILPKNWKNISNFDVNKEDEIFLKSHGWYKVQKVIPDYDSNTQKLDHQFHWFENDAAYESYQVINVVKYEPISLDKQQIDLSHTINNFWEQVRKERDKRIQEFEWRYFRHARELRMGMTPTDDINRMDLYVQALADITDLQKLQPDFYPQDLSWPTYNPDSEQN